MDYRMRFLLGLTIMAKFLLERHNKQLAKRRTCRWKRLYLLNVVIDNPAITNVYQAKPTLDFQASPLPTGGTLQLNLRMILAKAVLFNGATSSMKNVLTNLDGVLCYNHNLVQELLISMNFGLQDTCPTSFCARRSCAPLGKGSAPLGTH